MRICVRDDASRGPAPPSLLPRGRVDDRANDSIGRRAVRGRRRVRRGAGSCRSRPAADRARRGRAHLPRQRPRLRRRADPAAGPRDGRAGEDPAVARRRAVRARRHGHRGPRALRRRRRPVLPLGPRGRGALPRRPVGRRPGRRPEHAGHQRAAALGHRRHPPALPAGTRHHDGRGLCAVGSRLRQRCLRVDDPAPGWTATATSSPAASSGSPTPTRPTSSSSLPRSTRRPATAASPRSSSSAASPASPSARRKTSSASAPAAPAS